MSGGTGSGLFPQCRTFFDVPDVRLRILCLPLRGRWHGIAVTDEVGTNF